ncbi:hypothetical protein BD626DRAFT_625958 [Schizophyllum amplum]|uniref:F-box domain-containing protein n=1 Tax=Schizophyllum amplum TaxID=97359 RepID=A0A550CRV9_9AGAR|nr:hypothetical protein BD626DRAFT_625958 [Auriculariopsis ampla]
MSRKTPTTSTIVPSSGSPACVSQAETSTGRIVKITFPRQAHYGADWGMSQSLQHPLLVIPDLLHADAEATSSTALLIDGYLASISNQLSALLSYRNSFVSVSNLPDEVLAEIFHHYARSVNGYHGSHMHWTRLMLVCRHWRAIGMATPALWSHLEETARSQYSLAQLRLSGAHPLIVHLEADDGHPLRSGSLTTLEPHMDRIRCFVISSTWDTLSHALRLLGKKRRDQLRNFSVLYAYKHTDGPLAISAATTANIALNLRTLKLRDIDIDWGQLRNLISISIGRLYWNVPSVSQRTLVELLCRCPHLRRLSLEDCIAPLDRLDDDLPVAHTPLLRRVKLKMHVSNCAGILAAISLANDACISLYTYGLHDGVDVRRLLVPLHKHFHRPDAPILRYLKFTAAAAMGAGDMFDWHTDPELSVNFGFGSPQPCLGLIAWPKSEPARRRLLAKIMHAIPTAHIELLDMRCSEAMSEASCRWLLRLLPAIRVLALPHTAAALSCIRALAGRLDAWKAGPVSGKAPPDVPLRLRRIHWDTRRAMEDDENVPRIASELVQLLRAYCLAGMPLEDMTVQHHDLPMSASNIMSVVGYLMTETIILNDRAVSGRNGQIEVVEVGS